MSELTPKQISHDTCWGKTIVLLDFSTYSLLVPFSPAKCYMLKLKGIILSIHLESLLRLVFDRVRVFHEVFKARCSVMTIKNFLCEKK